ncbi:MAG: hypothetical protein EXR72_01530 [Myxococcales bacterium]|nr:hypothetical protein [Myxococcales bacterium]
MAHKILGVDLGAHTLKLARLEAGFRKALLLDVTLLPAEFSEPGAPTADRLGLQLRAVRQAIGDDRAAIEEVAIALPGELVTFRLLDLPFSDPRKIESVLGYELESQVLTPIEELVIDHVIVGPRNPGGPETRVLCAAVPRALIEALVKTAAELDLPLRVIGAAPLAWALDLPAPAPTDPQAPPEGPSLVIDVGHLHTTLCAVRAGKPELARSVPRAGHHFTAAIATTFRLDLEAAESAKREAGFISHATMQPESAGQKRMDACLREAARPLLRELRQTLASYRASYGAPIERLFVTGGGARLPGLIEHLGEELSLPTSPLPWAEHEGWAEVSTDVRDRVGIAVGVGRAGAAPLPQVNFRKGEYSYRSDYSFLRGKALHLAAALLAVLAFGAFNAFASLRGLRREQDQLATRLKRETVELFGAERMDARKVSEELKGGSKGQSAPPIPSITAFDVLDEISRRVPPEDKIKLDIVELDIKPKKIFIKATAETAQQVDDLADALAKIECFEEVQKGKLSTVTGPVVDGKASESKQFTLTITTTCP